MNIRKRGKNRGDKSCLCLCWLSVCQSHNECQLVDSGVIKSLVVVCLLEVMAASMAVLY